MINWFCWQCVGGGVRKIGGFLGGNPQSGHQEEKTAGFLPIRGEEGFLPKWGEVFLTPKYCSKKVSCIFGR